MASRPDLVNMVLNLQKNEYLLLETNGTASVVIMESSLEWLYKTIDCSHINMFQTNVNGVKVRCIYDDERLKGQKKNVGVEKLFDKDFSGKMLVDKYSNKRARDKDGVPDVVFGWDPVQQQITFLEAPKN